MKCSQKKLKSILKRVSCLLGSAFSSGMHMAQATHTGLCMPVYACMCVYRHVSTWACACICITNMHM